MRKAKMIFTNWRVLLLLFAVVLSLLVIFPNPNNGIFTIQLADTPSEIGVVDIYSLNGEKLNSYRIENSIIKINLSEYQNNAYILIIKLNDKTYSESILKLGE